MLVLAKSKMPSSCLRMANIDQKAFLSIKSTSSLFDGYQLLCKAQPLNFLIHYVLSVFFLNSCGHKLIKINIQGDIIMTFFCYSSNSTAELMLTDWLL